MTMDAKDNDLILPNQNDLSNEDVVSFYNSFDSLLKIIENNSTLTKDLFTLIKSGKKTIYNKQIKETKEFETAFLDTLEAAYPAFSKIAKNPKSSIRYEEDIVNVEKARKINGTTVKHLSSHSELVREIKEDNVIPSKLLTTFAEEDLAIYENRVFKTLVNNIVRFLTRRQSELEDALEASQIDQIDYNNDLDISTYDKVSFNLSIKVKKGLNKENNIGHDILRRTENLLTAYKSLKATPFMKGLAKAKDVYPPLMKTNIILHNADFKIVYNTWIFMERYSSVTYNIGVHDTDFSTDKHIENKLDSLALILMNTLMYHRNTNVEASKNKELLKRELVHDKAIHSVDMKAGVLDGDDYTFSEIFLDEARKLFSEEYEANLAKGVAKEVSMRESVRKMLKITNQMCSSTFDYKDDDLDVIGRDIDELIREASDRYEGLRILREEKEIDLYKNKKAEEEALRHLEELKKRKEIKEDEEKSEFIQDTLEERKKEELETLMREEAYKHQEELRIKSEEEKQIEEKKCVKHIVSRKHKVKNTRSRHELRISSEEDLILDLFNNEETHKLNSLRNYNITLRKSESEIRNELEERLNIANRKESPIKSNKILNKRLKKQNKKRREKVELNIKYEDSYLIPTNDSLHLFIVPTRLDIDTIANKFKTIEPIVIAPRKFSKLIGMKKTKVNSKTLTKEEIDSLDTRKIIGNNRTLVEKKTKGSYEKNN